MGKTMSKKPTAQELSAIREFIETTEIDVDSDEMRELIEREMPDLIYRLPSRKANLKKRRRPF
jgi:hypothetical protein